MPIPQRTLSVKCEISTGVLEITNMPPAYTGEVGSINIRVEFTNNGVSYTIPSGTSATMYLYYPAKNQMTRSVTMSISGDTVSGAFGEDDMLLSGTPNIVIQLTDTTSGNLIVACTIPIKITATRAPGVVTIEPATPDEIVYLGRSPYVGENGNWYEWNADTASYTDTGVSAQGPAGPAGSPGPQGPQGEKGDTGDAGPQGPQGATGPQGPQGPAGADGADGAPGAKGDKGDKGDTGDSGVYLGNTEPTDESVKVWINPDGESTPIPGLPVPGEDDVGKVLVVGEEGAYELGTPAPDVDDTLSIPGAPADAAAVGEAIEAISPEDESVGAKPWSSKQIIDTLCPPMEVTGNPVQCYPVANYPLGVKVAWEPRQEGEGEPSPENVRPIVGLDEVTVTLSGNAGTRTTATLALSETIYGGTVDAVTGVGSEEWSSVIGLSSSNNLGILEDFANETTMLYYVGNLNNMQNVMLVCCSHSPTANIIDSSNTNIGIWGNPDGAMAYIRLSKETASNLDEFKQWVDTQSAAGTPVQVAYKLATPTTFQATGNASLPALPGTNTIYTDADSVTVTGRADPVQTINALNDRIAALEDAATGG